MWSNPTGDHRDSRFQHVRRVEPAAKSIVAGAAAIGNAVENAVGARVDQVPITPERLLRAMSKL